MEIGLLGKANVGKSTFFAAATQTTVPAANFPFTTIDPNVGVAYATAPCACKHFGMSHETPQCVAGTRLIPVNLVDVAGLVPGAHEGKGLGNRFLDDARQASALIHVVDAAGATDIGGQPVPPGTHDPHEDILFVAREFELWMRQILDREWDKMCRETDLKRANLAESLAGRFSGLGITLSDIQDAIQRLGLAAKPQEWSNDNRDDFIHTLRSISKPMIIAANKADLCADPGTAIDISDYTVIPCSAESELVLRKAASAGMIRYTPGQKGFDMSGDREPAAAQKKALDMIRDVMEKIGTTGVQEAINAAVFGLLHLNVVYPVEDETRLSNKDGLVLPDAKLMRPGATARDLAHIIHADIGKGFLYAINCKTRQRIGADYTLQDGDVIKVVSSMSRG